MTDDDIVVRYEGEKGKVSRSLCRNDPSRDALAVGGPRPTDHGRDEHGEGCKIDADS